MEQVEVRCFFDANGMIGISAVQTNEQCDSRISIDKLKNVISIVERKNMYRSMLKETNRLLDGRHAHWENGTLRIR